MAIIDLTKKNKPEPPSEELLNQIHNFYSPFKSLDDDWEEDEKEDNKSD